MLTQKKKKKNKIFFYNVRIPFVFGGDFFISTEIFKFIAN